MLMMDLHNLWYYLEVMGWIFDPDWKEKKKVNDFKKLKESMKMDPQGRDIEHIIYWEPEVD